MKDSADPTPETPPAEAPAPRRAEPPAAASAAAARPYQARGKAARGGIVFFVGVFLFLTGFFWRLVEIDTAGWVTSVWIFISIVMMLVPLAWHAPELFAAVMGRRGTAVVFVTITITLAFGIAGFVGWATSNAEVKPRLPSIDLTKYSRYTLSDESIKLLSKVEGTVYISYVINGPADGSGLREGVIEQIRVFEAASSHIRFAEIDSVRRPELAQRLLTEQGVTPSSTGEDTDVIVLTYAEPGRGVTPGKQKEIKVEEWEFFKTSAAGVRKWLGEGVIASAMYELVFQRYKAYSTGGHGERALGEDHGELKRALATQNIEVETTPLLLSGRGEVPDDCEVLLILGPTAPFTPDEASLVAKWLAKGHTLFMTVDLLEERAPTGLEEVLAPFGLATRTNYEVIAPKIQRINVNSRDMGAMQGMSNQFPVYGDAYADHAAARALKARAGLATYFMKSTYVEADDKPPEGATVEVVCYAPSADQFTPVALRHDRDRRDYTQFLQGADKDTGKFPLIVTSIRKGAAGAKDARVILSGDTDVFADRVVQGFPANLDLARGLVQWGLRREALVAVSDRTLEDPFVTPTEHQKRFAFYWPLAVVFLPLLSGVMVWWSRRR